MKPLKLFEQFVNESKESAFSHAVLDALDSTILEMVEKIKTYFLDQYAKKGINYSFSEFEIENIRLGLIIDMLKSFEKYTEPTDKLVKIIARSGAKGIEITATIERDGKEYNYYTDAIGAGGHNIQSFHYRYLTKTTLPSAKIKGTLANEYIEKQKKMSKLEKFNTEIQNTQRQIDMIDAKFAEIAGITDEQIAKILKDEGHYSHNQPDWAEIVRRGVTQNFNNSEAEYLATVEKTKQGGIEFWRTQNIEWPTNRRKSLEKELNKLKVKLQSLM